MYQTFEACDAAGGFCDEVVIGEGTSGYPDAGDGHIGIQNVYCRYWDAEPYAIKISAAAFNLDVAAPEPEQITQSDIVIRCEPRPCCPPVDYIETRGNHTTVPWQCDGE